MNGLKSNRTATLMVTHYKRLLNYIKPDFVHVMEARANAHPRDSQKYQILQRQHGTTQVQAFVQHLHD